MKIKEYIGILEEEGRSNRDISLILGVSRSMVSSYKTQNYNPSQAVAIRVYDHSGIVLFPFSKEGVTDVKKFRD